MKPEKLRIFVVENHPDTVFGLEVMLDALGHEMIAASDMKSAIKLADEIQFDILLSDVGLPDGDGWTLMETLRAKHPIVGIAMSGYGTQADIAKSEAAGFLEHLVKPMTGDELENAINRAADFKRHQDAA